MLCGTLRLQSKEHVGLFTRTWELNRLENANSRLTVRCLYSGNAYGNVRIFVGHVRGAHLPNTPFSAMREERGIKRVRHC